MKVYVVMEDAKVAKQACIRSMGVFSSQEKAKEAIEEYEDIAELYEGDYKYDSEEFELDTVWTEIGKEEEEDDE